MLHRSPFVLQAGLPEFVPDMIGFAASLVLLLMLAALAGVAYRGLTGGIDWPDEEDDEEDGEGVRRAGPDDEWKFH